MHIYTFYHNVDKREPQLFSVAILAQVKWLVRPFGLITQPTDLSRYSGSVLSLRLTVSSLCAHHERNYYANGGGNHGY